MDPIDLVRDPITEASTWSLCQMSDVYVSLVHHLLTSHMVSFQLLFFKSLRPKAVQSFLTQKY